MAVFARCKATSAQYGMATTSEDPTWEYGFRGKPLCETETLAGLPSGSHQEACVRLGCDRTGHPATGTQMLRAAATCRLLLVLRPVTLCVPHVTSGPGKICTSEGLVASKSNSSIEQDHRRQGDLVVKGFKRLFGKYHPFSRRDPYYRSIHGTLSADQVNLKMDSLKQLPFDLLSLGQPMISLVQLLVGDQLISDPNSAFKVILNTQSALDKAMKKIQSAIYVICPKPLPSTLTRNNDQHLKELKSFRLDHLYHLVTEKTLFETVLVFNRSYELIQQLELSTEQYEDPIDVHFATRLLLERAHLFAKGITSAYMWLVGSEFDLVQQDWALQTDKLDERLKELLCFINQASNNEEDRSSGSEPPSKSLIQLSRSLIPIFKLSRLFFKRLSKRGMNMKKLPLFTELRSDQLEFLSESSANVHNHVKEFMRLLRMSYAGDEGFICDCLIQRADKINSIFETASCLIHIYIVPHVPDTDGFPIQTYYRSWLVSWRTQFSLAMQHLTDAPKLFENPGLESQDSSSSFLDLPFNQLTIAEEN
ncbi:hypothetical protein PSTT_10503 [Puccinia striiformis]|uniref:Uncharacterized protein n=1 Tax=Puccinia striiformis TaxID=27350 RepID=A0A2S4V460_9BASI|nr:hypothetical protein PSTT_10503 [Puccinia striiformis]